MPGEFWKPDQLMYTSKLLLRLTFIDCENEYSLPVFLF